MNKACFDIGGSSIKVCIFDQKGTILEKDKIPHIKFNESEINGYKLLTVNLQDCLDLIKNYLIKLNFECEVGISVPGVVDFKKKKILTESAITNFDIDIDKYFEDIKLIKKIVIYNDAKAAAIGEMIYGQNNSLDNGVILTIGTGLGGGIIINKKIYHGSSFASGEFSKLFSNINNEKIALDSFAVSSTSIGAMCIRYKFLTGNQIDGIQFLDLVKNNDKVATELFEKWINALKNLITNLQIIFDCQKILIGGGVSANQLFINKLKEQIDKNTYYKVNLESCKLTNDAACFGMLAILEGKYKED